MLDYYYNILYKDQFQELFGHLDIGKNPTSERNSYLVFSISFSSLNTKNVDSFKQSLNNTINDTVENFKNNYKSIFGTSLREIKINKTDCISSFGSLTEFVKRSKFRKKVNLINLYQLYILIDEYDKSINKALGDINQELYNSLYVQTDLNVDLNQSPKRINQTEQESLFRRFFSTIKDKFAEGGVGRVFITGVLQLH